MMPLLPSKLMLFVLSVSAVLIALYGAYLYVEGKGYDKATQEQKEEQRKGLLAYAERITQAGEQHEKDQDTINRLASESSRLRIKFPVCKHPIKENPNGGVGLLPGRVDQSFARLQGRVGRILEQCEKLNADARRTNSLRPGVLAAE